MSFLSTGMEDAVVVRSKKVSEGVDKGVVHIYIYMAKESKRGEALT